MAKLTEDQVYDLKQIARQITQHKNVSDDITRMVMTFSVDNQIGVMKVWSEIANLIEEMKSCED